MVAFKYRTAANPERALDIIERARLHGAASHQLNDWEEGRYAVWDPDFNRDFKPIHEAVNQHQRELRAVCLCDSPKNSLLWAYYADGLRGLAVEVEIPDPVTYDIRIKEGAVRVRSIDYRDHGAFSDLAMRDPEAAAYESLGRKPTKWAIEREVRVIANRSVLDSDGCYVLSSPVRRIIVGAKVDRSFMDQVRAACIRLNVPMAAAMPGSDGIEIGAVDPKTRMVQPEILDYPQD